MTKPRTIASKHKPSTTEVRDAYNCTIVTTHGRSFGFNNLLMSSEKSEKTSGWNDYDGNVDHRNHCSDLGLTPIRYWSIFDKYSYVGSSGNLCAPKPAQLSSTKSLNSSLRLFCYIT